MFRPASARDTTSLRALRVLRQVAIGQVSCRSTDQRTADTQLQPPAAWERRSPSAPCDSFRYYRALTARCQLDAGWCPACAMPLIHPTLRRRRTFGSRRPYLHPSNAAVNKPGVSKSTTTNCREPMGPGRSIAFIFADPPAHQRIGLVGDVRRKVWHLQIAGSCAISDPCIRNGPRPPVDRVVNAGSSARCILRP